MNASAGTAESLSLRQFLRMIRERWNVVLGVTLLAIFIAAAVAFLMTPVYRSTVLMMPARASDQASGLNSVLGQLGGLGAVAGLGFSGTTESVTTEAIALLQSRQLLEEFINTNNLMAKLFPTAWDSKTRTWKGPIAKHPTGWRAYRLFVDGIMDVYQDRKTNLVTLEIKWTDRNEAAAWANQLVALVNERVRRRAINDADDTVRYLNEELQSADTVQVQAAIYSMMESQLKIKAAATVRKQYAFEVLDPAVPSDRDVMLRPRRLLYIAFGAILGCLFSIALVLIMDAARNSSRDRA